MNDELNKTCVGSPESNSSSSTQHLKFTEAKLEEAIILLLEAEGYPHVLGAAIERQSQDVLIKVDLRSFLAKQYAKDGITAGEIEAVIRKLEAYAAGDLYESNKAIMKLVSDGFLLKREDHTQKDLYVQLIDYAALTEFREPKADEVPWVVVEDEKRYNAAGATFSQNIYKLVSQLEIVGSEKRIPDAILYINGLPLVVFEFKSAIREEATIHDAFKQLTVRYKRDIPELFKYNAFCVISDGVNSKVGSFFAPYEYWYGWARLWENGAPAPLNDVAESVGSRSCSPNIGQQELPPPNTGQQELPPPNIGQQELPSPSAGQQELPPPSGINSLYTMVSGLFHRNTLLDVIRNFVYLPDVSREEEKVLCRYPQYYAAKKLFQNILEHMKPEGDGKGGTYFGATGCGKSFTMLFLTRLLMRSVQLKSPTIVLITDRTDLDDQLSAQFTNAKGYIGDHTVVSVESREQLRELLKGRNSGGVFLTTIHKFTEDTELLTDRANVICISDEAHRSQVNLDQKLRVTEAGVRRSFGFAKYLHESLPNATYVGFTGTPIDATLDVFGPVVDSYTMTESVADEITVRIVYEGRAAKVLLNNAKLAEIEKYYAECAEAGASEYAVDKSKESMANMASILGDPQRIEALAADFVKHYEKRLSEGSTVAGKAMFVSSSRPIAYAFYKAVLRHLGERSSRSFGEDRMQQELHLGDRSSRSDLRYETQQELHPSQRSSRSFANSGQQELPSSQTYSASFTRSFGMPEEWHTGNLPHRSREGLVQFITFRLADSMPKDVLVQFEREICSLNEDQKQMARTKRVEKYLDSGYGCCALDNPEMAQVVQDALKYHDGKRYNLIAWSIMPNHVHVLIRAMEDLPKIVQSWKSFTGKWALRNNTKLKLGITGKSFWQPEYWDRFIRNEEHFNRTVEYILNNPEKAHLSKYGTAQCYKGCLLSNGMQELGDRSSRSDLNYKVQQELHPSQRSSRSDLRYEMQQELHLGDRSSCSAVEDEVQQELHPSQIKMVMTRGKDDPAELYDLVGDKEYRKELDRQFKNVKSNFKVAIVVDMWLTGFDVPFLDTIYIDKPVQRHNLIQTISRVNRKFEGKNKGLVVDYIGIKTQMNLALAHYSKADKSNIEEVEASIIVVKDHLDLLSRLFHRFDARPYFSGSSIQQLQCLNKAAEYAQLTEKIEKRFMGLVKRLKAAYDISSGSDGFTDLERDQIHFYLAVRSIVAKLTKGEAPDTAQMNAKVRRMIAEALQSDGVEEIFKLGEDGATEIDIFGGEYLAKIEKVKLPNTKIKLLQQLLKRAIDEFKRVNKIKGVDFSHKFQALVEKYNERKEEDVLVSNVLEDFSDEIIDLFYALKKEKESFSEMGIDFEEKAFYDILKSLAHKYDFEYPEDKLILLSKEVKKVVDDKAKYTDWSQRADIKAELKVDLIILLAEHGYPPVSRDEVYKEIFEQAENFKKYQER